MRSIFAACRGWVGFHHHAFPPALPQNPTPHSELRAQNTSTRQTVTCTTLNTCTSTVRGLCRQLRKDMFSTSKRGCVCCPTISTIMTSINHITSITYTVHLTSTKTTPPRTRKTDTPRERLAPLFCTRDEDRLISLQQCTATYRGTH